MDPIQESNPKARRLVLCVGGSIAAYKTLDLVRRIRKAGCSIQVVMTQAATRFVTPLSFQALSGQPTRTTLWDEDAEQGMGHIALARWPTDVMIAPATADLIARLAHGCADDLVTTLCLATTARIWVVPAMNHVMWAHPATQANVALLQSRGVTLIGPTEGAMAEDESGLGRMVEPETILASVLQPTKPCLANQGPTACAPSVPRNPLFHGLRVVISAGPTLEDIDPVRYMGNRSSGKMGFALAAAAARYGAEVHLIAGPVNQQTPPGVATRVNVRSAEHMRQAVLAAFPADIYIGAAAVADYTPATTFHEKIKKTGQTLTLKLVRTPDILSEVAAQTGALKLVVGFAAETHDIERYAREKLESKHLDLIIANRVGIDGEGFESDDNAATAYWRDGMRTFARCNKVELAEQLLQLISERLYA